MGRPRARGGGESRGGERTVLAAARHVDVGDAATGRVLITAGRCGMGRPLVINLDVLGE